ncbi:MAG: BamA/TamA family outer membrane protein [Ignavibacteria bacterium]|nr:BamA/TamA family outer membrane protein [Ignavibacteria bacterium]
MGARVPLDHRTGAARPRALGIRDTAEPAGGIFPEATGFDLRAPQFRRQGHRPVELHPSRFRRRAGHPRDSRPQHRAPTLPSSSTLSGSVELLIDTRDNPFNPRSGVQLRNSYAGGSKSFTRPGAIDREHDAVQRIEADVSWFRELFTRGIVAVAVHGRELRGGSLDASDLYRLGGASTLRGYREEQFSGTRLAWSNLEFRYSLGGRSFAFVFFDFGYIYSAPGEAPVREELTVTRNGYGIGGRLGNRSRRARRQLRWAGATVSAAEKFTSD